jgi:hypothetical protein
MGITPDRTPGPSLEEEIQLEDNGLDPSVVGAIVHKAGALLAKDSTGIFDLRSGAGLSEAAHKALRQLIHFIDDGPAEGFATGAFKETTGTVFPTFVAWYVAGSTPPAGLIVSLTVTWTGIVPTTEVWKMYDTDGSTVLVTVTDTISYSGIFETSRTRAIA